MDPLRAGPAGAAGERHPHYGATLLRVYERREDRRAYAVFAVGASAVVAGAFGAGLVWPVVGSWLLTLMLTWSPWHYTGQNYGIALLFLRRRGVAFSPATKRCIYASFGLSFALTFLALHGARPQGQYAPTGFGGSAYAFLPLGIPTAVQDAGLLGVGALYVLVTAVAVVQLKRAATWRDLGPTLALLATQALWFSVPVAARKVGALQGFEPLGVQHAAYAFLWVAVGHSIQYLWICAYMARRQDPGTRRSAYLAKTLLAGAAIWTVPALLFAPGALGGVPYDAGLALLVSAAVNVHHFILDGAIWKLRDGRVARMLIRREDPAQGTAPLAVGPRRRLAFAPVVWAVGIVSVGLIVAATVEEHYGLRPSLAAGDVERAEAALARLRWMGRDSAGARAELAMLHLRRGDTRRALDEAETALALHPAPEALRVLGDVQQRAGRPGEAIASYQRALREDPDSTDVANNLAWIRATHPEFAYRDPVAAVSLARDAVVATGARSPAALDTLAAAYASAARYGEAVRQAERAHALALEAGNTALADAIAGRIALYREGRPYRQEPTPRAPGAGTAARRPTGASAGAPPTGARVSDAPPPEATRPADAPPPAAAVERAAALD